MSVAGTDLSVTATPSHGRTATNRPDPRRTDGYLSGLAAYVTAETGRAATATGLARVAGGNARATWRCDLHHDGRTRGVILRVTAGSELHLSSLRRENDIQLAMHRAGVPAPEPLYYDDDPSWLGGPFAVIDEIPNCLSANNGRHLDRDVAQRFGQQMWTVLGRLANVPVSAIQLPADVEIPTADCCGSQQLSDWEERYRRHEIHPHPAADAALRWLHANTPAEPKRLVMVHGDYRAGNLLHDEQGNLLAVVDWEMAHVGDPLEDLAWSLDARQDADHPELAGGLIAHDDAVGYWQAASGLAIDPSSLRWWQVFNAIKALAIWTISGRHFVDDEDRRPVDGRIGWLLAERQHRILVDLLSPTSRGVYYRYQT